MTFSWRLVNDQRVQAYYEKYLDHPFVKGLGEGTLSRDRFKQYLIQDSLYLKDYGKVYAGAFLLVDRIEDLQFLHSCIGVVVSDETNMHTQYLMDYGLDVYKVDKDPVLPENRAYLDYMLSFLPTGNVKEIFMSALPCTLTYEHIGKALKEGYKDNLESNYYKAWIEAYAGKEFEEFSLESCRLLDRICEGISKEEEEHLIQIFLTSCEYEMAFWDMSYKMNEGEYSC
ncbi:thiaminase II [Vallitalea okinawensis]|uniref:thiaminase II n=1 Tax=Vallitalea okinawensis TaxID=2078660 RepID=UPI000CFCE200|nr:thiaminase II [Vallitalea okinawensis]